MQIRRLAANFTEVAIITIDTVARRGKRINMETNLIIPNKTDNIAEFSVIQSKIHEIRGCKVMLDFDLAAMYQVETRTLNQSVKRNRKRFPADFMFQLTENEWKKMSSQIVMTYPARRPKSAAPYAFTDLCKKPIQNSTKTTQCLPKF